MFRGAFGVDGHGWALHGVRKRMQFVGFVVLRVHVRVHACVHGALSADGELAITHFNVTIVAPA